MIIMIYYIKKIQSKHMYRVLEAAFDQCERGFGYEAECEVQKACGGGARKEAGGQEGAVGAAGGNGGQGQRGAGTAAPCGTQETTRRAWRAHGRSAEQGGGRIGRREVGIMPTNDAYIVRIEEARDARPAEMRGAGLQGGLVSQSREGRPGQTEHERVALRDSNAVYQYSGHSTERGGDTVRGQEPRHVCTVTIRSATPSSWKLATPASDVHSFPRPPSFHSHPAEIDTSDSTTILFSRFGVKVISVGRQSTDG
ncbi:hypothetical protein C8R44DRAFT_728711 [Mycena epipterygia]|nr:hypothetical protein C8R44DRAFT_728711 [Mycena epipterygia]